MSFNLFDYRARPFEPRPSLYPVIEYLASLCVHHFPNERCPYCEKFALADNPEVFAFLL